MSYAAAVRRQHDPPVDTRDASIDGAVTALLRTIAQRDRARNTAVLIDHQVARVERLLAHARLVSPTDRAIVRVVDVQAALDGDG